MELVVPWKVLLNESYEKLSDVSLDLLVVWRVPAPATSVEHSIPRTYLQVNET